MNCSECNGEMFIHGLIDAVPPCKGWVRGAGWTCECCDSFTPYSADLDGADNDN